MKNKTIIIATIVAVVVVVVVVAVVAVRGNDRQKVQAEEQPATVEATQSSTAEEIQSTEAATKEEVELKTEVPTEEVEVPTEIEEQIPVENTYSEPSSNYTEPSNNYSEPTPTYNEPSCTPPASSGKVDSLLNGDDDNTSYKHDYSKDNSSNLKFG